MINPDDLQVGSLYEYHTGVQIWELTYKRKDLMRKMTRYVFTKPYATKPGVKEVVLQRKNLRHLYSKTPFQE